MASSRHRCNVDKLTQPPTLSGMGNHYWLQCDDAVWLETKGRMVHSTQWQVERCGCLLSRAIPARGVTHDEALCLSMVYLLALVFEVLLDSVKCFRPVVEGQYRPVFSVYNACIGLASILGV